MVVLHEDHLTTDGLIESLLVETFHEEAARIAEHLGFEDQNAFDGGGGDFHRRGF